jgi:hypothetical protein
MRLPLLVVSLVAPAAIGDDVHRSGLASILVTNDDVIYRSSAPLL